MSMYNFKPKNIDTKQAELGMTIYEDDKKDDTSNLDPNAGKQIAPTDQFLFEEEAKETAAGIFDPLIAGAEKQKEVVDVGAEMQIEGIKQAIPYVTRQFEAYQAKTGFGTGMQMRQSNELIMDIAETVGQVYDVATMQKYEIDSKISEYQSAMAAGEYEIATQLYNQSLSQAQFTADYLGMPYVQPEIGYMYDQMTAAQAIINDPNASDTDRNNAQSSYDSLTKGLQDLGYTGDIGEGLQTYQQGQIEMQQMELELQEFIANELYDVQMASTLDTTHALQAVAGGMSVEEAIQNFPYADWEQVNKMATSESTDWMSWSQYNQP